MTMTLAESSALTALTVYVGLEIKTLEWYIIAEVIKVKEELCRHWEQGY